MDPIKVKIFQTFQSHEQALRSRRAGRSSAPPPPPFPRESFLSMCPFFQRALEVLFMKEVTKNVHEN